MSVQKKRMKRLEREFERGALLFFLVVVGLSLLILALMVVLAPGLLSGKK